MYPPILFVLIVWVTSILGDTSLTSKCSPKMCPAVKATICVKVKPKNENQVHYVKMSKCELKQIKCFHDVETAVVPVKLCKANSLRDGASNDKGSDVSEIQDKISEVNKPGMFGPVKDTPENQDDIDKTTLSEGEPTDEPQNEGEGQATDAEEPVSEPLQAGTTSVLADGTESPLDATTDEAQSKEVYNTQTSQTSVSSDPTESPLYATTDEPQSKERTQAADINTSKELDYPEVPTTEYQANNKDDGEKHKLNNAYNADDGGKCPQKCPIRDVMVCARCSHRVYRTFMSACYMRMYQCQNPKEKLELVSRHACQGSAPYLGDMSRPINNLAEPLDNDPVLNYIFTAQDNGHPKF